MKPLLLAAAGGGDTAGTTAGGEQGGEAGKEAGDATDALTVMLQEMPLRSIIMFDPNAFTGDMMEELLEKLNGKG